MATFKPARVPAVVAGLSLFWGGVLSAFFWTSGFNFYFLAPWLGAMLVGAWVAQANSDELRSRILAALQYRSDKSLPITERAAFGCQMGALVSSLGPVPVQCPPLPRLENYALDDLLAHAPPELAVDDLLQNLLGRFVSPAARARHPAHAACFDALAMTLLAPSNLNAPAGIDRHKGRSLLMHALLVLGLMSHRAPSHVYVPGHGRRAIELHFKLDPLDPLIPLLALSHDLGKVRKTVFNAAHEPEQLLPGHVAQSAKELSKLPELWRNDLATEDRQTLLTILFFSDKASQLPVQKMSARGAATVTSDRLQALFNLLGECDRLASAIESGVRYSFGEAPAPAAEQSSLQEVVEPVNLFNALTKFMVMEMPVNARSPARSVGFKYSDEHFGAGRQLIIIDEIEFVQVFSSYLGKPELNTREGKSSPLTKMVLEALDENGFLYRFDEGEHCARRPATSCLYKIEFRGAADAADAPPCLVLSSAFLVDVTDWQSMAKLQSYPNCLSTPSFAGFRLGRQPARARRSVDDAIASESLGGLQQVVGVDITTLGQSRGKVAKAAKPLAPEKIIHRINRAVREGAIKVAASDETAFAVVGQDAFFTSLGLQVQAFEVPPEAHSQVGILKIKRSLQQPGSHVVHLDRRVYSALAQMGN